MKCEIHNNEANFVCLSCGKALCSECTIISDANRNACSEECMKNLKILDEAALLSVTKAKKTLTANVMVCRFLGIAFIIAGIAHLFLGMKWLMLTAFLSFMGVAFIIGAQIYASALKDKQALQPNSADAKSLTAD